MRTVKIAVLAGSKAEFDDFKLKKQNNSDEIYECTYVNSIYNFHGRSFDMLISIGSFWEQPIAKRIYLDILPNIRCHSNSWDLEFLNHE